MIFILIYLISGKDKFRRQLKVVSIKKDIFASEEINGFNYQELENPDPSSFAAAIQTPAFAGGKKMILIKNFKALENKSEDDDIEKICLALKLKPQENIVIFNSEKITGTLKLVKKIKKDFKEECQEEKFELFKSWDLKEASTWLCKIYPEITNKGKLDYQIAEFISEQVGVEDSAKLYSELERLVSLGKELTIKNLESELDSRSDVFKFIKHITQDNRTQAIKEFKKIVKARELNIGLLAILETSISNSLKLKLSQKKYPNKNELASFLGVSPGRLYYQQQELSKVSIEHLNKCLEKVLDLERQVKTGKDQLERALVRDLLCS